jgi:hypothetical protein
MIFSQGLTLKLFRRFSCYLALIISMKAFVCKWSNTLPEKEKASS